MYLNVSLPLPVNSNPGMVFPHQKFASDADMINFAARLVIASIDMKERIELLVSLFLISFFFFLFPLLIATHSPCLDIFYLPIYLATYLSLCLYTCSLSFCISIYLLIVHFPYNQVCHNTLTKRNNIPEFPNQKFCVVSQPYKAVL